MSPRLLRFPGKWAGNSYMERLAAGESKGINFPENCRKMVGKLFDMRPGSSVVVFFVFGLAGFSRTSVSPINQSNFVVEGLFFGGPPSGQDIVE